MRVLCLVAVLFTHVVHAQPPCPFDAKVRALADEPAALAALAKAVRRQPGLKEWIDGTRARCKVETNLRFVRVLDGLSHRCATALVELELHATDCRTVTINVGGGPEHGYALVAPDAKGTLQPVWTLWRSESFVPLQRSHGSRTPEVVGPPPSAGVVSRVECGQAVGPRDGGSPSLLAIASDPDLRFDGCTLRGIPEESVRRAMRAVLQKNDSTSVSCQFYEEDEVFPTCAVTTQVTEDQVAVISSGGFEPGGVTVTDPPRFVPTTAYVELTDAGPRWLCNDLSLDPWQSCLPLKPPPAAREGCTPPPAKQALAMRAATEACSKAKNEAWRHEVSLGAGSDQALAVERLALEYGHGILNEEDLASKVVASAAALARCAKSVARYDGAVGALTVSAGAVVSVQFAAEPGDEDCVQRSVLDSLRALRANAPRNWGVSVYGFRLGLTQR